MVSVSLSSVTKYYRPDALNHVCFSQAWGLEVQIQDGSITEFWQRPPSWSEDSELSSCVQRKERKFW